MTYEKEYKGDKKKGDSQIVRDLFRNKTPAFKQNDVYNV